MNRKLLNVLLLSILGSSFVLVSIPTVSLASAQPLPGSPHLFVWNNNCGSPNVTITNSGCGALAPNDKFRVQINVTNAPSFNGYEFFLFYDPAYLKALSADLSGNDVIGRTVFTSPSLVVEEYVPVGIVRLVVINLAGGAYNGRNGTLVHIQFNVTSVGVSPLTLAAGLRQPSSQAQSLSRLVLGNEPIEVFTSDGYFRNEPSGDDAVVYDSNSNGLYDSGEPMIYGLPPIPGTTLKDDPKLKYLDARPFASDPQPPGDGVRNATEAVFYDSNADNVRQISERIVGGSLFDSGCTQSCVKDDPKIMYVDTTTDNIFEFTRRGPVASFTFSPFPALAGDSITFNATTSSDVDNSTNTVGLREYAWVFGDGTATSLASPIASHIFSTGGGGGSVKFTGNFSVRLTVTDFDGFASMRTARVQIDRPPFHDVGVQSVTASPQNVNPGVNITVTIAVRNDGTFFETFDLAVTYGPPVKPLGSRAGLQLASDATDRYTFTLDTTGLSPGPYEIIATIAVTSSTDENPANNSARATISISITGESPFLFIVAGIIAAVAALFAVGLLLKRRRRPKEGM